MCTCLFCNHHLADTSSWDTLPYSQMIPKDHPPTIIIIRSGPTPCDIWKYFHALYIFYFTLWKNAITGMKPRGLNRSLCCVFDISQCVYESEWSLDLQKTKQEIINNIGTMAPMANNLLQRTLTTFCFLDIPPWMGRRGIIIILNIAVHYLQTS